MQQNLQSTKSKVIKFQSNKQQVVAWTFTKCAVAVTLLILSINWFIIRFDLEKKFKNIGIEVWAGLILTIGTTYLQFHSERTKENRQFIEKIFKEIDENNGIIKSRIDSVLIQLAQVRQEQQEIYQKIKSLEDGDRIIEETITNHRLQYNKDQTELVRNFYIELAQLNGAVSYLKGHKEGNYSQSTENRLQSILEVLSATPDIATDILKKETD